MQIERPEVYHPLIEALGQKPTATKRIALHFLQIAIWQKKANLSEILTGSLFFEKKRKMSDIDIVKNVILLGAQKWAAFFKPVVAKGVENERKRSVTGSQPH